MYPEKKKETPLGTQNSEKPGKKEEFLLQDFHGLEKIEKIEKNNSRSYNPYENSEFGCSLSQVGTNAHFEVFKSSLGDYAQSIKKVLNESEAEFFNGISVPPKASSAEKEKQSFYLDIQHNVLIEEEQRQKFAKDLKHESFLKDFLSIVIKHVRKQLADQLIYIADLCWLKYHKATQDTTQQLLPYSKPVRKNFSDSARSLFCKNYYEENKKLLATEKIKFLNLKGKDIQGKINQPFLEFINIYTDTVFYVLFGQFQNPHSKNKQEVEQQVDDDILSWGILEEEVERNGLEIYAGRDGVRRREHISSDKSVPQKKPKTQ